MSYLRRMYRRHPGLRTFLVVLISVAMSLNPLPIRAMAQEVIELGGQSVIYDQLGGSSASSRDTGGGGGISVEYGTSDPSGGGGVSLGTDANGKDGGGGLSVDSGSGAISGSTSVDSQGDGSASSGTSLTVDESKKNTQSEFTYEDKDVRVVAQLADPAALPAGVSFVVKAVTPAASDYDYDAYLSALNESVTDKDPYNNKNTLLYDVSFMATDESGKSYEVEPTEGTLKLNFNFKADQLVKEIDAEKAAEVSVNHLPKEEGKFTVESVESTAKGDDQIQMTVDSLSVYAFSYTVDYKLDGYEYSMEGGSSMKLSELFAKLGIDEDVSFVNDVTFTNADLLKVEQTGTDWTLTSLQPFTSDEKLTVTMASGLTYVIAVTDAQSFNVTVDSAENVQGSWYLFLSIGDGGEALYWISDQPIDWSSGGQFSASDFYKGWQYAQSDFSQKFAYNGEEVRVRLVDTNDLEWNNMQANERHMRSDGDSLPGNDGGLPKFISIKTVNGGARVSLSEPATHEVSISFQGTLAGAGDPNSYYVLASFKDGNETRYWLSERLASYGNGTKTIASFTDARGNGTFYRSADKPVTVLLVKSENDSLSIEDAARGNGCTRYSNGQIVQSGAGGNVVLSVLQDAPGHTTLEARNAQPTPENPQTIIVEYYDIDQQTKIQPDENELIDPHNTYVLAYLTPKGTGANGDVVAWALERVDPLNPTSTDQGVSIDIQQFNACDVDGNATGTMLNYDSNRHDLNVRMYHRDGELANYKDCVTRGSDTFSRVNNDGSVSGFDFMSNSTEGNVTTVKLHRAYPKYYQVKVTFDPESTDFTSGDRYFLFVNALHETTEHTYFLTNFTTSAGQSEVTYVVEGIEDGNYVKKWKNKNNGNVAPHEHFSSNWDTTAYLLKASKDEINLGDAINNTNSSRIAEGQAAKNYSVTYKGTKAEEDKTQGITYYTTTIELKEITAEEEYDFKSILGPSLYYGITADHLYHNDHLQSNFAVNHYTGKNQNTRPDLTGESAGRIVIGQFNEMNDDSSKNKVGNIATSAPAGTLKLGQGKVGTAVVFVDSDSGSNNKVDDDDNPDKSLVVYAPGEQLSEMMVKPLTDYLKAMSSELAQHDATFNPVVTGNSLQLDTTGFPDDATIFIDADRYAGAIGTGGGLRITKKDNQVIIFNFKDIDDVTIGQFYVNGVITETPEAKDDPQNVEMDKLSRHIVWNCNSCTNVTIKNAGGIFLVPKNPSETTVDGTSGGWIVSDGLVWNKSGEFHFFYSGLPDASTTALQIGKTIDGKKPKDFEKFKFYLDMYYFDADTNGYQWKRIGTTDSDGSIVIFDNVNQYVEGWTVYRITESEELPDGTPESINTSKKDIFALVQCLSVSGAPVIGAPRYFDDFKASNYDAQAVDPIWSDSNESGFMVERLTKPTIDNYRDIEAHKVFEGGTLSGDDFNFTLTEVADEFGNALSPFSGTPPYTDSAANDPMGDVLFNRIRYNELGTHYYQIAEVAGSDQGIVYDASKPVVRVNVVPDCDDMLVKSSVWYPDSAMTVQTQGYSWTGVQNVVFNLPAGSSAGNVLSYVLNNGEAQQVTLTSEDIERGSVSFNVSMPFTGMNQRLEYTVSMQLKDSSGANVGSAVKCNYISTIGYSWGGWTGSTVVQRDSVVFTNSTDQPSTEEISVSGTKTWVDGGKEHNNSEDVPLTLWRKTRDMEDPVQVENPTLRWNGDTYTFTGLPREDANHNAYSYSVREGEVEGYEPEQDGNNFTNTITGEVTVTLTKTWDDGNNQDGIRPSAEDFAEKVYLWNGDTAVSDPAPTYTDNGDGTFTITWSELPKYDNGVEIAYKVSEDAVDGYTSDVTSDDGKVGIDGDGKASITNTHTPEVVSLVLTKTWDDNQNADGERPETADFANMVHLYNGNTEIDDPAPNVTDNNDGTFTVSWSDLPKYANGTAIEYKVSEDAIDHYDSDVTAADGKVAFDSDGNASITNEYNMPVGNLVVTKDVVGTTASTKAFTVNVKAGDKYVIDNDGNLGDDAYDFTVSESVPLEISGLRAGVSYEVIEVNPADVDIEGWSLDAGESTTSKTVTIDEGETETAELINKYTRDTGSLEITKTVTPTEAAAAAGNNAAYGVYVKFGDQYVNDQNKLVDEPYELTVTPGTKLELTGLPTGLYTILETLNKPTVEGWDFTSEGSNTGNDVTITKDGTETYGLVNNYVERQADTGKIKVLKHLSPTTGLPGDADGVEFHVTIKQADGTQYVGATGALQDDPYEHAVYASEVLEVPNVPIGNYVVEEVDPASVDPDGADADNWTFDASGSTTSGPANIAAAGDEPIVDITNSYTRNTGTIKVAKTLDPADAATNKSYGITITTDDGATFVNEQGELVTTDPGLTVKAGENLEIENVPTGLYTIIESATGREIDGYLFKSVAYSSVDNTGDTADEDGTVTLSKDGTSEISITNTYETTKVSISKRDITTQEELPGATLQVIEMVKDEQTGDTTENVVKEWISKADDESTDDLDESVYIIEGLKVGVTYTLRETAAPEGYEIASDTTFTLAEDGTVATTGESTSLIDGVIIVNDARELGSISIKKTFNGVPADADVSGLTFEIEDPSGAKTVVTYADFTGDEYLIAENVPTGGVYKVTETNAENLVADHELVATSTTEGTGKVAKGGATISLTNTYREVGQGTGSLTITKKVEDRTAWAKAVADATEFPVTVKNSDGKFIDKTGIASDTDPKLTVKVGEDLIVDGLEPGEYTVAEGNTKLSGFISTGKTMVPSDGKVTIAGADDAVVIELTNSYEQTSVTISKSDMVGSDEIPGATLQIIEKTKDESTGETVETVVEQWVSGTSPKQITGLKTGVEYTLRESIAPDGYTVTTDATFTIAEDGTVTQTGAAQTADGTIVINDELTKVTISKRDITGGDDELPGALLQILDEGGNVVELNGTPLEWTSTDEAKTIEGLKTGVTYTLHEETAPTGYKTCTDTTFTIKADGTVQTTGKTETDASGAPVILVEDAPIAVYLSKCDVTGEEEVAGATIQIFEVTTDETSGETVETKVDEWTSKTDDASTADVDEGVHLISGLEAGKTYVLRETVAPNGYTYATDTTFTVNADGSVTTTGATSTDEDGNPVMLVNDAKTVVRFSKIDTGTGNELAGAHIQILNATDDSLVTEWDSDGTTKVLEGVLNADATYKLVETSAPEGYKITATTTFTIDRDGKLTNVTSVAKDADGNDVILINDEMTEVHIRKTDIADGKEVKGATLQVIEMVEDETSGELVENPEGPTDEWVSDGENDHIIKGLKTGVTYILRETIAPDGYAIATDTTFSIDAAGTVVTDGSTTEDENGNVVLLVEDAKTSVSIAKTDIADGEEVSGATLQVFQLVQKDGEFVRELVDEWVSVAGKPHVIEGLKTGISYILVESVAPEGYTLATETDFCLDENGKVDIANSHASHTTDKDGNTIVLVEDAKNSVRISKADITSHEELAGAELQVIDSKGKVVDSWTSVKDDETTDVNEAIHIIEGLTAGETYTLRETVAPEGYAITTDTTFSVDEHGVVTTTGETTTDDAGNTIIVVNDAKTVVRISKCDITGGEEIAGADMQIITVDKDGNETVVKTWTSKADDAATADVNEGIEVIEGLKTGQTYILRESLAPVGYKVTTDTTFVIDETGKVTTTGETTTDDEGNEIIVVNDAKNAVGISKVDITSQEELVGAELVLTDSKGNEIDRWTSEADDETTTDVNEAVHLIEGLTAGETYTLTETVAPEGYTIATATTFTVDQQGKVNTTGSTTTDENGNDVILFEDAKTSVLISKTAIGAGDEVPGATLQVIGHDKDGNETVFAEWVSGTEPKQIEGLKVDHDYILRETIAPDGYCVTTDTTFSIDETGKVTTTGTKTTDADGNTILVVEDALTKVTISKKAVTGEDELAGATIQILDANGDIVKLNGKKLEWVSTDEAKTIEGLTTGVEYTLHEEVAPNGYTVATDTTFTIEADGTVKVGTTTATDNKILIEDSETLVKISKVDVTDQKELPGAEIQILDSKGNVIDSWTSVEDDASTTDVNEAIHEISGLTVGETYTLRETVAPEGYAIATDTTFTIDKTGTVISSGSVTDDGIILVEDAKTSVKVKKCDIVSGDEVEGAHIQIIDSAGTVVEEWDSTTTAHEICGLKTGETYILRETVAPEGYAIATDTTFKLGADGKIAASTTTFEGDTLLVNDAKTVVRISKTDITGEEEVPGATLQVIEKVTADDGTVTENVVRQWVSKADDEATNDVNEAIELIEGLKTGVEYTLRETIAPQGYDIATDTTFTIDETGKVTTTGAKTTDADGNTVILVKDDLKAGVFLSKVDVASGEEVAGATIQILDSKGKVVDEWTSDGVNKHVITDLVAGETYTLRETVAPDGYTIATDTTFSVDEHNNVTTTGAKTYDEDGNTVLLVEDAKTKVTISKCDIADGSEVVGATLQVIDSKGNVVESWVSQADDASTADVNEAVHVIEGLLVGESYTLRETIAPDGYAITTDTTFTIDETGKVTTTGSTTTDADGNETMVVENAKTEVRIAKTDIADGAEVPGATLQVIEMVEKDGKLVEKVVKEWVSTDEPLVIRGLKTGVDYILRETVAPEGYTIATDTSFRITATGTVISNGSTSVDDEGNTVLLVEDAKNSVRIAKTDVTGQEELVGAEIVLTDSEGNEIDRWTSEADDESTTDVNEAIHVIEGLKVGETYTLTETVAPEGYAIATATTFTVDEQGKVTTKGATTTDEDGNTIILIEDAKNSVIISKTDIADGEEIAGAKLTITDSKGNVFDEWTSGSNGYNEDGSLKPHQVSGLKTGETYTLTETVAPEGYTVATATTFTVDKDGKVTTTGSSTTDADGNTVILVEDAKTVVRIAKSDIAHGEEVVGATIEITDSTGKVVESWTSVADDENTADVNEAIHVIEGLKVGETYTMTETIAPDGYAVATATTFTIDENGKVTTTGQTTTDDDGNEVMVIDDALTKVSIAKSDIVSGKEVSGATIQVITLDKAGNEVIVEEWTSVADKPHVIEGLKVGIDYVLRETVAPEGYAIASDTTFCIGTDGKVDTAKTQATVNKDGVILVEDSKNSVKVSKVDIADGEELPGAKLQVIEKVTNDETGETTEKVVDEWISKVDDMATDENESIHEIEGLKSGVEYILRETVAPEGYTIATDTTFTVDEAGKVTSSGSVTEDGIVLVEDAKTSVSISKVDTGAGKEIDGATIQVIEKVTDEETGETTEKVVDEWVSKADAPHTIEGLKTNTEYVLRETVAPEGYTIATDTTFQIDETGKVTSSGSVTEDGVVLVEDSKTSVTVSKVDTGAGEEIDGATIQVIEKVTDEETGETTEKVVEEWVSKADAPHTIEGLKTNTEYVLRETVAPDGYAIATDTTFQIDETGKVTSSGSVTEDGIILIEDELTKVSIAKADIVSGEEVSGATIQVITLDKAGNEVVVDEWVSEAGKPHEIVGLRSGIDYILRETVAPEGYATASDTTFCIGADGKVDTEKTQATVNKDGVILVEDSLTKVTISKVDTGAGEEIDGATIQVIEKVTDEQTGATTEKVIDEWVSEAGKPHTIEGLKTNIEYVLRETVAPEGYTIATDTTFTIDETGKVTSSGSVTEDGIVLVEDSKTSVTISKVDTGAGKEIDGAKLQVIDSEGNIVDEWTSSADAPHTIEGLKVGEEYTLRETVAPEGYTIATDTTFKIDETGKVTSSGSITENGIILVEDSKTSVLISKVDTGAGEEIDGATLQVIEKVINEETGETTEKVVEEWVSKADAPHEIEGLKTNTEYILRETVAPEGYAIATDTTFTIDETGKVTSSGSVTEDGVILVEDSKTSVSITKADVAGGEEVSGATIQVCTVDKAGNRVVVDEWVSEAGKPHVIEGLKTGIDYVLVETVAPEGYAIASETTFCIGADGKVDTDKTQATVNKDGVILVEDAKTSVTISKVDTGAGEEIDGAKLQVIEKVTDESTGETTEKVVEEWTSKADAPHEIVGLKTGTEYILRETVAPEGYLVATDTTFTIDETGKVTSSGSTTTDEDGNTVLLVEDDKTSVTISKVETGAGDEVDGATLQVIDSEGNVVEEWVSSADAPHTIEGLKVVEEYTLRETIAPDGYLIATDTTFSIDENGKVTSTGSTTTDEDGNTVLLVEDDKTVVRISKCDIASGEEVVGAQIQIIDSKNNVVEQWTSVADDAKTDDVNEAIHVIEGLKVGETYTMRETIAPDGYAVTTDTTFVIGEDGKVTTTATKTTDDDGNEVMVIEDALTKVAISKVDLGNGKELEGAHIQVVDADGNIVEEWDSTTEAHVIEGLKTGVVYQLVETVAPAGHLIAATTTFTIEADGTVKSFGTKTEVADDGTQTILIEDAPTAVRVAKTDTGTGDEIEGATIQVLDKDGKVVDEWKSTKLAHTIRGKLSIGETYTLKETVAPDGYTITSETTFTLDENGKVTGVSTISKDEDGNEVILVNDDQTVVRFSKVDIDGGKEVAGAKLQVLDAEGKVVDEWTSDGKNDHVIKKLKTDTAYTLHEEVAPEGYTVVTDTTFTIDATGKVYTSFRITKDADGHEVVLVEDAKTSVLISKVDTGAGDEIDGAKLQVIEKVTDESTGETTEKVVEEWTSKADAPHEIVGLKTGTEYTLRETVAPEGYLVATDTTFTIDETGKVTSTGSTTTDENGNTVLLVEDDKTSVSISKVDTGAGEELEGATIQLFDSKGNKVEEWVSGTDGKDESGKIKPHTIEGLKVGETYTLRETVAPEGYAIATDTTFTIDETGKVTSSGSVTEDGIVLIEDWKTSVTLIVTDVNDGKKISDATVEVVDEDGNVVDSWTTDEETTHTVTGLKTGKTYTVRQTSAPDGYLKATETKLTLKDDGTIDTKKTTTKVGEDGTLLVEDDKTSVTLTVTDVNDGKKITDATVEVIDEEGKVVDSWTSDGESTHTVRGLKTGRPYTIRQTTAPDGYLKATETTVTLKDDGTVDTDKTTVKVDEDGTLVVEDDKTSVTLTVTDAENGKKITDATVEVIDEEGKVVDTWTSDGESTHTVRGLKTGRPYTIRQTSAPDGYVKATESTVTLMDDGTVDTDKTTVDVSDGTLEVKDNKTLLKVTKVKSSDKSPLENATIQLIEKTKDETTGQTVEKVVKEWTSKNDDSTTSDTNESVIEVKGLKTNTTYVLRELKSPTGFVTPSETELTIDEQGKVQLSKDSPSDMADDVTVRIPGTPTKVSIDLVEDGTDNELAGGTIQVQDKDGNVVELDGKPLEWTPEKGSPTQIEGLPVGEEYVLCLTAAPDGYFRTVKLASFSIKKSGEVVYDGDTRDDETTGEKTLLVKAAPTKVSIEKVVKDTETPIKGSHIQIIDSTTGDVVEEWDTDGDGAHTVVGKLLVGRIYRIVETVAGEGYSKSEVASFRIKDNGDVEFSGKKDKDGNLIIEGEKETKPNDNGGNNNDNGTTPSDNKKSSSSSTGTNSTGTRRTTSTVTTGGTTGNRTTSTIDSYKRGGTLGRTGDPMAATTSLSAFFAVAGAGFASAGLALRRRRNKKDDK